MRNFKDFGIEDELPFVGKSIEINEILNLPIKVLDYKVGPSKKKPGTDYLTLQIEIDNTKRVVFTGGTILIRDIKKVPKDGCPFNTTIVKIDKCYKFT